MTKVTISDVARDAGVSRATADRVLNRRGGVSSKKEGAVLTSARSLGLDRNFDAAPVKALRVCVLMKPPQNPYYAELTRGFRQANRRFAQQAVTAYVTHIDVTAPETIVRQLGRIARNYDALVVVAPAHPTTVQSLRDLSVRIPVITLSTDLPLGAPHHYVGPDNERAGRLAGEIMGRMLGQAGGNILFVAGLSEFSGHEERRKGFRAVLRSDYPASVVAAEIDSLDRGASVADAVVAALREIPNIRGIYNISQGNDEISRRIEARGIRKDFCFIGHDLTATTRSLLRERRMDVVIDQDPVLEAMRAMEIVLHHYGRSGGGRISGKTPLRVHFRENAEGDLL
jgi:LacI family transcriptional regulator